MTRGRRDVRDHATARVALAHPDLSRAPELRGATDPLEQHVLNLEGEAHRQVRAVLSNALDDRLPELLAGVRPQADRLLSGLAGEVDLAGRFVRPLVLTLLDRLLGLTDGDPDELGWWHDTALALEFRRADPAAIRRRVGELVERRRERPRADVVSVLAAADLPGDVLVATVYFAFDAGYVNTVNFLGLALLALAHFPEQYAWLRTNRSAVPGAVDELLRFAEPPSRASMRVAARDLRLGDAPVPAGTTVWIHRAVANRDPARFPEGNRLELGRPAGGSLAFGAGRHFCLGAGLVRGLADLTLLTLLDRVESLALAPATPDHWDFPDALPLVLRPVRPPMSD